MKKIAEIFILTFAFIIGLPAIALGADAFAPGNKTYNLDIILQGPADYLPEGIAAFVLLVLAVLLIRRSIRLKQIRMELHESKESVNSYMKEIDLLESELSRLRTRENEIMGELEKEITDSQGKAQLLKLRIEELTEENAMLEVLLARYQKADNQEETGSSDENESIKKDLIGQMETILARLKQM